MSNLDFPESYIHAFWVEQPQISILVRQQSLFQHSFAESHDNMRVSFRTDHTLVICYDWLLGAPWRAKA
jgi:hypothetical protein